MTGFVVNLVLLGAALAADPDACVRPDGDSCVAADHSLMQVRRPIPGTGHRVPKKDNVPVALAQVTPVKMLQDNRTIANLTNMIEKELQVFEADVKLLVFGQDKLCTMATHHEARVRVLVKILEVEAGKTTGAHMGSKAPQHEYRAPLAGPLEQAPQHEYRAPLAGPLEQAPQPVVVPPQLPVAGPPVFPHQEQAPYYAGEPAYYPGEMVQYKSPSTGEWLTRKVKKVDGNGKVDLNYKTTRTVGDNQIRPLSEEDMVQQAALLQEPDMVTATKKFGPEDYPTEKMVTNKTLDNLTVDVQQDVHWVEEVLQAISREKDRIEVVGTDSKTRIEDLVSLLTMETSECNAGGFYQPGDSHYHPDQISEIMAQTGETKQTGQATQEAKPAPTEEESGEARLRALDEKLKLIPPAAQAELLLTQPIVSRGATAAELVTDGGPMALLAENVALRRAKVAETFEEFPGWNLTLINITTALLAELTTIEDDIAILVDMKNKVGVAGDTNTEHLEDLDNGINDALKGALRGPGADGLRRDAGEPGFALLETDQEERQGSEATKSLKDKEPLMMLEILKATKDLKEKDPLMMLEMLKEEEERQGSEERRERVIGRHGAGLTEKTAEGPGVPEYKFPAPKTGPIENLTLANATMGIDQQIFNLEQDMSTISREKREVCLASARYLKRLQAIIKVMNTLEC